MLKIHKTICVIHMYIVIQSHIYLYMGHLLVGIPELWSVLLKVDGVSLDKALNLFSLHFLFLKNGNVLTSTSRALFELWVSMTLCHYQACITGICVER